MPRRRSHNERTQSERESFARYVRERDSSPTVEPSLPGLENSEEEDLQAQGSDESGVNLDRPTVKRARKLPLVKKVFAHIESHFVEWVVGVLVLIGASVLYLKFDFSRFEIRFDSLKDDVSDLKQTSKEQEKQLHQHDIKLREHDVKFDSQKKQQKRAE